MGDGGERTVTKMTGGSHQPKSLLPPSPVRRRETTLSLGFPESQDLSPRCGRRTDAYAGLVGVS